MKLIKFHRDQDWGLRLLSPSIIHQTMGTLSGVSIMVEAPWMGLFYKSNLVWVRCYLSHSMFIRLVFLWDSLTTLGN